MSERSWRAFAANLAHNTCPPDYAGDFRDPGNAVRCWCVVRSWRRTATPPRQCRNRRSAFKAGKFGSYCCAQHRAKHADAQMFAESLGGYT